MSIIKITEKKCVNIDAYLFLNIINLNQLIISSNDYESCTLESLQNEGKSLPLSIYEFRKSMIICLKYWFMLSASSLLQVIYLMACNQVIWIKLNATCLLSIAVHKRTLLQRSKNKNAKLNTIFYKYMNNYVRPQLVYLQKDYIDLWYWIMRLYFMA